MSTTEEGLKILIQSRLEKMYTSTPGNIVAMYHKTCTCDIEMSIPLKSSVTNKNDPIVVIRDVPIVAPAGSKFKISYPIAKGDQCLVIFAQSELGEWKNSVTPLKTISGTRRYHISNAIAIPSLYSPIKSKIMYPSGIDAESICVEGDVKVSSTVAVGTSPSPVAMGDPVYTILEDIVGAFTSIPIAVPNDGGASVATKYAASLTAVAAKLKTIGIKSTNLSAK